nr:immunoglobulin heavy chain junction region [Macaca mulatta]MOV51442.1 immunoglobulin heavy chain junction region [Macaca mulatta]MOV52207.1 immunoglobulin heavy chain junction region [Macaca mulatta]MOV52952.1 immunoglobulin heavy chain junction region [Macaca mulatta]
CAKGGHEDDYGYSRFDVW